MSGKGSKPRPIPDRQRYESEFDRIFGARDAVREMPEAPGSDQPSSESGDTGIEP